MSNLTWEQKEKKFGKPKKNKVYTCKVMGFHSKQVQTADLTAVYEDDVMWRTADDGSEFDENNWNVIEWILKDS